jgi:hypothetical protein
MQFANPAAQLATQAPAEHVAVLFVSEHVVPQPPQLVASEPPISVSHPVIWTSPPQFA